MATWMPVGCPTNELIVFTTPFTTAGAFCYRPSCYFDEMRAVVEDGWPERVQALLRFQ